MAGTVRANLDASSFVLVEKDWAAGDKDEGEETETEPQPETAVKTIDSEQLNYRDFAFPGNASFRSAIFKGDAYFLSATFKGDASFNSATFKGDASFDSATFKGNAYFLNATFKGDASFLNATFKGDASFNSATFKGDASFDSATFKGDAYFGQVTFESHANFYSARFLSAADFTALHSSRAFALASAEFPHAVPQFTQSHFTESPRLDHLLLPVPHFGARRLPAPAETWELIDRCAAGWPADYPRDWQSQPALLFCLEERGPQDETGDPPAGEHRATFEIDDDPYRLRIRAIRPPQPKGRELTADDIAAYTALRRLALHGEDHETERLAFKGEMRARRALKQGGGGLIIASYVYDALTDFGQSFLRPFIAWVFLAVVFAGIYAGKAYDQPNATPLPACGASATHAALLSAHNALLFATGGQRSFVEQAQECLYGVEVKVDGKTRVETRLPPGLGLWGTLHTLLSAILIFFVALALRNRFKIK